MSNRTAPIGRGKTALATMIGNLIEFYDFNIYGVLSAIVFGRLFFSDLEPATQTFMSLATFAVGFLARPLGGIFFGHFGDRFGRKPMLVASLLTMGTATTLMGLLPTYAAVGWLAPVLLVSLRFCQGLGIGGEWGGAVTLMLESAPKHKRGIFGAVVQSGSGAGIILSTATVTLLLTTLTPEQMDSWGWRIPLLLSAVLVVVGIIVRARIEESPAFATMQQKATVARAPLPETLHRHWRMVVVAIGMYIAVAAFGFTQGVFFTSYLVNTVHLPQAVATTANLIAAIFYLGSAFLGGFLSDRIGRTRTYIIAGIFLIPAPFLMFGAGETGSIPLIYTTMVLIGLITGTGYGAQAALFFELFPARVRYTGISLGFQVAAVLGGGLTPIFAQVLTQATGSTLGVSAYLAALCVLLIFCTLLAPRVLRTESKRG